LVPIQNISGPVDIFTGVLVLTASPLWCKRQALYGISYDEKRDWNEN